MLSTNYLQRKFRRQTTGK